MKGEAANLERLLYIRKLPEGQFTLLRWSCRSTFDLVKTAVGWLPVVRRGNSLDGRLMV